MGVLVPSEKLSAERVKKIYQSTPLIYYTPIKEELPNDSKKDSTPTIYSPISIETPQPELRAALP